MYRLNKGRTLPSLFSGARVLVIRIKTVSSAGQELGPSHLFPQLLSSTRFYESPESGMNASWLQQSSSEALQAGPSPTTLLVPAGTARHPSQLVLTSSSLRPPPCPWGTSRQHPEHMAEPPQEPPSQADEGSRHLRGAEPGSCGGSTAVSGGSTAVPCGCTRSTKRD